MFANTSDAPVRYGSDSSALPSSSGLLGVSANVVANTSDYNCNLDAYMVANTSDHNCDLDANVVANTSDHNCHSTQLQARTLIAPSRVTLRGAWHQAGDNFESRHTTAQPREYDAEVLDSNGDLISSASENVLMFKPLTAIRFTYGHMLGEEKKE
jgi:hypothetical protein